MKWECGRCKGKRRIESVFENTEGKIVTIYRCKKCGMKELMSSILKVDKTKKSDNI